jgi:hypothetical protein
MLSFDTTVSSTILIHARRRETRAGCGARSRLPSGRLRALQWPAAIAMGEDQVQVEMSAPWMRRKRNSDLEISL